MYIYIEYETKSLNQNDTRTQFEGLKFKSLKRLESNGIALHSWPDQGLVPGAHISLEL